MIFNEEMVGDSGDDDRDQLTNDEVSLDMTVLADEMNLEVDSKDEVMHI